MIELKPCPFCGSEAKFVYDSGNEHWPQKWHIACTKCEVSTKQEYGSSTWYIVKSEDDAAKKKVMDIWHSRAPSVAPEPVAWTTLIEIDWVKRNTGRAGSFYAVKAGPNDIPLFAHPPRAPLTGGELWSWTRSVMSHAACIQQDYAAGKFSGYEQYSAHLDAAAATRADELEGRISAHGIRGQG